MNKVEKPKMRLESVTIERKVGRYGEHAGKEWLEATVAYGVASEFGGLTQSRHTLVVKGETAAKMLALASEEITAAARLAFGDALDAVGRTLSVGKAEEPAKLEERD